MKDKKTVAQILGENLKRIRTEKGVSRKELADTVEITEVNFGKYERGERLPPLDKIFAIADFLKVSVASLTGENNFSDNVPNIEKIVSEEIFEYRFKRAINMATAANYFPEVLNDGQILIQGEREFTHEDNGTIIFSGGNFIKFKNRETFVEVMESAERYALFHDLTFNESMVMLKDSNTNTPPNVEKLKSAYEKLK